MGVIKTHHNKNYTVMSNYHLRDKNISLKAKGLLSIMLSLPEHWKYTVSGLVSICNEGETAIRNTLKELESNNYLIRERIRENGKVANIVYHIFENPQHCINYKETGMLLSQESTVNFPDVENPRLENPIQENPILESTGLLNTNKINTNKINKEKENKDNNTPAAKKLFNNTSSSTNTVQQFMNRYNEICEDNENLSKVKVLTDKRKKAVLQILKKYGKDTIMEAFDKISKSDFLLGNSTGDWCIKFDWIFKEDNFVKIIEGNYDTHKSKKRRPSFEVGEAISEGLTEADKKQRDDIVKRLKKEGRKYEF